MMLLESDMFMDALNASATNKKDPKKRKRRTSVSKDGSVTSDSSPPHTPTNSSPSAVSENKSVPLRFYQDTLDTEETKENETNKISENSLEKSDSNSPDYKNNVIDERMDIAEPVTLTVNGLKGVLCYHKKKGPKKSIKWKADLEEIQYFELDETERVNVTKTFTDMKYLERIHEREAFQKARNLINDDIMEEKTIWKPLIPIDYDEQIVVEHGKNSKEKEIQAIRQKGTLQPLYFHKSMIPDSPLEPDVETHTYSEPQIIPLDDLSGSQNSDFRNMPWPEPKGNAPAPNTNVNMQSMFQPPISQFPSNFTNPQFPVPGFQGPNLVPSEWQNGMPPSLLGPGMGPGHLIPGPMAAPGLMMPPEGIMMAPDMFNGPSGPMFPPPIPPENFNMMENINGPQNIFPPDFNMPQGMPGPDGGPNFRGAMRGRGSAGHWRGKPNWEGPPRGRGGHARGTRKAVCIYFQRKGSCRQGDNCGFLHTGPNRLY